MFRKEYGQVFEGDAHWRGLQVPKGDLFSWENDSTYVKAPPFFDGVGVTPPPVSDIKDARVLAMLADSVTTDHISPAGSIGADSPGRKISDRQRRSAARISTPTARAAATMK